MRPHHLVFIGEGEQRDEERAEAEEEQLEEEEPDDLLRAGDGAVGALAQPEQARQHRDDDELREVLRRQNRRTLSHRSVLLQVQVGCLHLRAYHTRCLHHPQKYTMSNNRAKHRVQQARGKSYVCQEVRVGQPSVMMLQALHIQTSSFSSEPCKDGAEQGFSSREKADLDGEGLEPPHPDRPREQHLELRRVGGAPPMVRDQIRRVLVLAASGACIRGLRSQGCGYNWVQRACWTDMPSRLVSVVLPNRAPSHTAT